MCEVCCCNVSAVGLLFVNVVRLLCVLVDIVGVDDEDVVGLYFDICLLLCCFEIVGCDWHGLFGFALFGDVICDVEEYVVCCDVVCGDVVDCVVLVVDLAC